MANDNLIFADIERVIATGRIRRRFTRDPRGARAGAIVRYPPFKGAMLSWIRSRRARELGRNAMVLLVAACASSGDAVPPVSVPEPLAIAVPGPVRPRTRPAKQSIVHVDTTVQTKGLHLRFFVP